MSELATKGSTEVDIPAQAYGGVQSADDIIIPRIKASQPKNAGEETAPLGAIFTTQGEGTEEVVAKPGEKLTFFVLAEPYITYSWEDDDGKFVTAGAEDPRIAEQQAKYGTYSNHKGSPDKGFNFLLGIPELDEETPYKVLFTRSSAGAGKVLNTVLSKAKGPWREVPFELSVQVKRGEYTYSVLQVRQADIKAAALAKLVEKIAPLVELAEQASKPRVQTAGAIEGEATDVPSID